MHDMHVVVSAISALRQRAPPSFTIIRSHWSSNSTLLALDSYSAGTMAHYDIFRHHLAMKFHAYGHALWDPDHGNLYPPVEVGDVGYICEGKFHYLFNVLRPADHPSH